MRAGSGRPFRLCGRVARPAPRCASRGRLRQAGRRRRDPLDLIAAVRDLRRLGRDPALAGPSRAEGRRERQHDRLAPQRQHRGSDGQARGPPRRPAGVSRGVAGHRERGTACRTRRRGRHRSRRHAQLRPVGVAGRVDVRARCVGARRRPCSTVILQCGLWPGARRAGRQAGAGSRL